MAPLDRAAVRRHFAEQSAAYNDQTEWRRDAALLQAIDELTPAETGHVADIGAGTGLASNRLRDRGLRVLNIDMSYEMLRRITPRGLAIVADAECLPIPDGALAGCAMRQLLHYTDDDRVCQELARVLSRDGWIVSADVATIEPRDLDWWNAVKRLTQPLRRRCYSIATHRNLFERHGFVIEAERTLTIERRDDWSVFCAHMDAPGDTPARRQLEALLTDAAAGAVHFKLVKDRDSILYSQGWHVLRARRG